MQNKNLSLSDSPLLKAGIAFVSNFKNPEEKYFQKQIDSNSYLN